MTRRSIPHQPPPRKRENRVAGSADDQHRTEGRADGRDDLLRLARNRDAFGDFYVQVVPVGVRDVIRRFDQRHALADPLLIVQRHAQGRLALERPVGRVERLAPVTQSA